MKRWLKSILVLVCVMALCGALTACGSEEKKPDPNALELTQEEQQEWFDQSEQFIYSMDEAVRTGTSILTEEDPVYGPALQAWENALPEIGEIVSVEGASTEFTKTEGTIDMIVHGSSHDADVIIRVEMGEMYYEATSITTNVIYSFGELMKQAGLNTLLGMGTTFAVLILLSLIIAAFGKVLGGAGARQSRKAPAAAAKSAAAETAQANLEETPQEEDYMNDAALIAVIAAAIAAYEGSQSTDGFVVRSIRKSRRRF